MLTFYKFLIYWSLFGYALFIAFYIWETKFNVKKVGTGFNSVKVPKYHFVEWHYWLILFLCGPAVLCTVIIVTLIDYLFHGNQE